MALYKTLINKIAISPECKTKQKEYLPIGSIPIVDQGKPLIGGYTDDINKQLKCDLPVIVFGDHTCNVKYVQFPFGAGADGIKVLKPTEDILPKYLYYGTQYLVFKLPNKGYARHYQHIEKMNLFVPSLSEQEKIVARIEELFSQLDSGVETLKKIKQQLAVYRQAVLKEAFRGRFTKKCREHQADLNIEYFSDYIFSQKKCYGNLKDYKMYIDIDLPSLPTCWKWVNIGDIIKKTEYGTSKKSEKNGIIPVLRMGNIQKYSIDWSDLQYTNYEDDIKKFMLKKGDVLFNRTNSPELVGKTAIFSTDKKAIFAGYLIRLNQFDCINPFYLNYYLNSYIAKIYGTAVRTDGVNQSNINGNKLCSYPFPLCCPEEQEQVVIEIESRLSICDNIEKTVDITLQQADALRQSILKKAFEGDKNN